MTTIKRYKDEILYYQIDGFNVDDSINHLFSTRIGWKQDNLFNDLSEVFNIPEENIYRVKQVHGKDVIIIKDEKNINISIQESDGLITDKKGISLCTYHADCVPIYFYDKVNKIIGLAHAGWKGTLNNIVEVMIQNMIIHFNCNLQDIIVAIGPSIGPCCYEIGHDVEILFKEKYPNNSDIIKENNGKTYLNLWKSNKINLLNLGINEKNIFHSNLCTSCNIDSLYSYRKEKGTKNRMIAAIMLNQ